MKRRVSIASACTMNLHSCILIRKSNSSSTPVKSGLEPGMQIDLFEQLASSMPMDVISTMLGVPAEDRDRVRHLTNDMMHDADDGMASEEEESDVDDDRDFE